MIVANKRKDCSLTGNIKKKLKSKFCLFDLVTGQYINFINFILTTTLSYISSIDWTYICVIDMDSPFNQNRHIEYFNGNSERNPLLMIQWSVGEIYSMFLIYHIRSLYIYFYENSNYTGIITWKRQCSLAFLDMLHNMLAMKNIQLSFVLQLFQ